MSSSSSKNETKKTQIFAALKNLREASIPVEKCKALTCLQSAVSKSASLDVLSENQMRDLYKLIVNALTSGDALVQEEAHCTLVTILRCSKNRKINLFSKLMQISMEDRRKIFQVFEELDDESVTTILHDKHIVEFFKDCLSFVSPDKMKWLKPNFCTDNIKAMKAIENRPLTNKEMIEEYVMVYVFDLLHRLYRVSDLSTCQEPAKLNILFMDKVAPLAYMGHKRQRAAALKVLQLTEMGNYLRSNSPTVWQDFKNMLQNMYSQRMTLLVGTCEPDWSLLWTTSIQLLGTDLHRGAGLINNLLSVEEKAFKSVDTAVRRQAFLCWKLIVDNFALDEQELATARRVKLLCIPLNAKNSKTEMMTLTKLEVWWHLIYKLYDHIDKFANPVLTQFLNFCFGPLGDTPLLSSKFNVIASPGKRFLKTKIVAVDALMQLLTHNTEDLQTTQSSLEKKIPGPVSNSVFQEYYKNFIHCVGEAILAINQLTDKDCTSRSQVTVILWKTLLNRVRVIQDETAKVLMYKEIILLVIELSEQTDNKPFLTDALLETLLPSLDKFPTNCIFHCETMVSLMGIFTKPAVLHKITRKHHDLIKSLLLRGVKPPEEVASYISNALQVFRNLVMKLDSIETENVKGSAILWLVLSDMVTKYMSDEQEVNEGNAASHNFETIQTLVKFPFTRHFSSDVWQMKSVAVAWKTLYKQFNLQANLVPTVKPNECVSWVITVIQNGIELDNRCVGFAISCLDGILTTVNYKHVLDENGFLPIVRIINNLCVLNLPCGKSKDTEAALRALSSVLITLYGHVPTKVTSCLEAVKPAIEQIMKPCRDESLVKEIANTWETIMSIFKGLGALLSSDVILSYQEAIRLALQHGEAEIVSQTLSCLKAEEHSNGPNKDLIRKFLEEVELDKIIKEPAENCDKLASKPPPKVTKFSGSFLNRKTASPRPGTPFDKPKDDKKRPFFPEPESQEYVTIKSDFKFDVNRLTEHQKESLLRRREDIPALYNDMSQSCSQDTQNLQEWFEKRKSEIVGQNAKLDTNGDNAPVLEDKNPDIGDADKENKIESDREPVAPVSENAKEGVDTGNKAEKEDANDANKNLLTRDEIISPTADIDDNSESDQSVAKKLNFESRVEYPDNVTSERKAAEASSTSQNSDAAGERSTRRRETKRGVKRKVSGSESDSEESIFSARRRKSHQILSDAQSDSDSVKSIENDEVIKQLSKRTKNEMSRLQINMVFDSKQFAALPSRRRSKAVVDTELEPGSDDHGSPEAVKAIRNRTNRGKDVEKDAKPGSEQVSKKRNGRRSRTAAREESKPDSLESSVGAPVAENASRAGPVAEKTTKPDSKSEKEVQEADLDTVENISEQSLSNNEDSEEIVESSQASSITGPAVLDKNYTEKQCFIRIDKMQTIQPGQTIELGLGNEKTKVMKGHDPDSPFKVCTTDVTSADLATKKSTDETEPVAAEKSEGEKDASTSEERPDEPGENKSASSPPLVRLPTAERTEGEVPAIFVVNSSPPELRAPQNDVSMSPVRLPSSVLHSSSPKNSLKRFSKLKTVTSQGRAAHMLGLVTKQAIAETRSNAPAEEDSSSNNSKRARESDEEFASGKKERHNVLKELERLGSPSGSRQEKIFNKMRTTLDNGETAAPQTAQSHFGNLKNDGEKASLGKNIEKERNVPEGATNMQTDKSKEKTEEDNTSVPHQDSRESLPMLEWSSANPPSLTASPTASILKRQRQLQLENDPENPTPACKRKRVSFADPPVSMEMGYEITASTPPHRMSKIPSASRIFFPRKDSPVRLKQTKIKGFQMSPGKSDGQSDPEVERSSNVVNIQADQMTDDGEESSAKIGASRSASPVLISLESENRSLDTVENDSNNQTPLSHRLSDPSRVTLDNLSMEIEIAAGSRDSKSKDEDADVIVIVEASATEKEKIEDSETQKDIFDSIDISSDHDRDGSSKSQKSKSVTSDKTKPKSPSDESGLRCVDISILTNTSANGERLVRAEVSATETLEDTVDVQNVTGLNSTTNSDELFSVKPIRTSTQATETANSSEFDTMTVTDSVFSNLPFSQASQISNDTMDLDQPELLDSTKSIFPSLTESRAPIDSVIGFLADTLWKPHLSNYLHSKGIDTVGNLARLTEREINWIPVKRSPKVPFVRDVLQHFEKSSVVSLPSIGSTIDDAFQNSIATTPNASIGSLPPCSTPITRSLLLSMSPSETAAGNSVNGSAPLPETVTKSTETQVSVVDLLDEIDASVVLKSAIKRCSAENILANYKLKMKNMAEEDLERATIKMLGIESKSNADAHLKTACRTSGLGKVLGRLPDIFSHDKQFFSKVLATYRRKISAADCMEGLNFEEIKAAICQRCTSSDLAEMLSTKLKDEAEAGITTPMTELSSLNAMLKRMPKDLIISHTVANEELISPLVVLDIALQNNTATDVSCALNGQSSAVRNRIFNELCTVETLSSQIKIRNLSDEALAELLRIIGKKMEPAKFLDIFNEVMKEKFISKKKPPSNNA